LDGVGKYPKVFYGFTVLRFCKISEWTSPKKMFDFYFATNIEKRKEREQEQGESRMTPKKTKRKDATMRWTMAKTAIKHKPQQHWWKLQ